MQRLNHDGPIIAVNVFPDVDLLRELREAMGLPVFLENQEKGNYKVVLDLSSGDLAVLALRQLATEFDELRHHEIFEVTRAVADHLGRRVERPLGPPVRTDPFRPRPVRTAARAACTASGALRRTC